MKKKTVLIVMPIVRPGGVGSSLASFYPLIDKTKYDISIFPITYSSNKEIKILSYSESVLACNETLSAYYCNMPDAKGWRFVYSSIIKLFGKLFKNAGFEELVVKRAIERIEKKNNYDTVMAFVEGFTTKIVSYFHCANKVAWVHCNYNYYLPKDRSEEDIYNHYKHIVTVARFTTEVFKQRYPSLASRTSTIYNPIDIDRVTRLSNETIDDERFQKASFTLISVGRIVKVKRFTAIPQIAQVLKKEHIDFKWYILGLPLDKTELELIKKQICEFGLQDIVLYLGGKLNPYPYFRKADLLVSTSESEACPMIFNEAKILNLPIVSTDFPSAFEFIDSGTNGVITSLDKMAGVICSIATNMAFYQTLKSNSSYSDSINNQSIESFESLVDVNTAE